MTKGKRSAWHVGWIIGSGRIDSGSGHLGNRRLEAHRPPNSRLTQVGRAFIIHDGGGPPINADT